MSCARLRNKRFGLLPLLFMILADNRDIICVYLRRRQSVHSMPRLSCIHPVRLVRRDRCEQCNCIVCQALCSDFVVVDDYIKYQ